MGDIQLTYPTCFCDKSCLFLGDCCFDYLYECDSQYDNLEDSTNQQMVYYRRFLQYIELSPVNVIDRDRKELYDMVLIPMVKQCPEHTSDDYAILCENPTQKNGVSDAPVVFQGAMFYNVFCAVCHDIPQEDIEVFQLVVYQGILGVYKTVYLSTQNAPVSIWRFFLNNLLNLFEINRLANTCKGGPYKDECDSYMAPLTATFSTGPSHNIFLVDTIYKNEACFKCLNASIKDVCHLPKLEPCKWTEYTNPTWESFFDFTGNSKRSVLPTST